ncbi:T9SS type A sorting domain-containing protein [Candidatus Gracilibacteria bacterium]|nr:T9SS type A sorting domain-containing protein [Candidatus Gracilibacteria bacterium]
MRNLFLSIIMFVLYQNTFAQYTTIKTPTDVSVEAIYFNEFTSDELAEAEALAANWLNAHGSNAIRVAPASKTYNCHDYAWHYSDGGTKRWVNQIDRYGNANISKYWSGSAPTYQLTTSSKANKVFYPDGDHSAEVISPGVFESKWGAWPRYRHAPNDCPYTSSNLQYYAVPVSGNSLICSSGNYSTLNISGASYNWSGSKVSISGSGSSVSATKTSNGSGWIKINISSPHSGTTVTTSKKIIWLGNPGQPITNPTGYPTFQMALGQIKSISVASAPGYPYQYIWDITGSIEKIVDNGASVLVEATELGWGNFRVKTRNQCGYSAIGGGAVKVSSGGGGGMMMLSISPNPANSEITISINSKYEKETFDENEEWGIEIYNLYHVLQEKRHKLRGNTLNINTSSWKEGIYMIRATYKGEVFNERLLIKR